MYLKLKFLNKRRFTSTRTLQPYGEASFWRNALYHPSEPNSLILKKQRKSASQTP